MVVNSRADAVKALSDANPEVCFYVCDGSVLKNLDELLSAFGRISDEVYSYHANKEKNDFSSWVGAVFQDSLLAKELKSAKNRKEAAKIVKNRLSFLRKKAKK